MDFPILVWFLPTISNRFLGLGSLENSQGDKYYDTLTAQAKEYSTFISFIGIEGEDCGVSILGKVAKATSGSVTIVKPLELQRRMRQIIDNPVIATDVNVSYQIIQLVIYIRLFCVLVIHSGLL